MKKDRNSFFSQYGVNAYSTQPYGYPSQNFNQQPINNFDMIDTNDINSRISRIERELTRMDERISKLESQISTLKLTPQNNSTDYNFANSMYMV